jgi:UDP-N-acetylglucosamine--N-acetylmuramyl-(pentapeptide) pyrophosphoryl-undecaprenol N-acetylglucosamine transferase
VDDHQTANACYLTDTGCAVLIPEHELSAAKLAAVLTELCASRQRLLSMAEECRSLARPHATREVINHCLEVACARSAK